MLKRIDQEVESLSQTRKFVFVLLTTVLFLTLPPIYSTIRLHTMLPDRFSIVQGRNCSIDVGPLIECDIDKTQLSIPVNTQAAPLAKTDGDKLVLASQNTGEYNVDLKLMGIIPVKTVTVDVREQTGVIPGGEAVGIKIHTEGVLVVAISQAEDTGGNSFTPAKDSGLKPGDVIIKANGVSVKDSDHFSDILDDNKNHSLNIEYVRDKSDGTMSIQPVQTSQGYKIGAWVRDSTAGIGTVTFIRPDSDIFAALGHGIADVDTGQLLKVADGSITECNISSVTMGKKGSPGELKGVFTDNDLGIILENTPLGLYGKANMDKFSKQDTVEIATRFEVNPGDAQILCSVDGKTVESYDVKIEKVMTQNNDGKGMTLKITDPDLLEKTGGIVQGMSGSPILQGGRLVGAVTHVFVNDPTRGYGIFIELMMDKTNQYR